VICGLAMLADPDRAAADAVVPALDEEIVETGGGLRLYRRPPLQSPAGRELTVPPGSGLPEQPSALRYWHPARGIVPVPAT
jgi:hypothetical protein